MNDNHLLYKLLRILVGIISIVLLLSLSFMIMYPFKDSISKSIDNAMTPLPPSAYKEAAKKHVYVPKIDVVDGIHLATGLVYDKNFKIVKAVCTRCHSAKLITQAKASREGWQDMIRWMQKTQGLENLGEYEPIILDYLAEHYAPEYYGRRTNLDANSIEWYTLKSD